MRRVPFSARCRQGWCQNWERCHRPQQLQMHLQLQRCSQTFWRTRSSGKGGGDGGGGHRPQHPQWRKAIAISLKVPAEKGTELSAIGGIRLVEEAAASRDAVMPRPGGTRPAVLLEIRLCRLFWALCLFVSSCQGFPRMLEDVILEEWTRLSGRKKIVSRMTPVLGSDTPPPNRSVLYYCVYYRVQLWGLGRPGGRLWGPTPSQPDAYFPRIFRFCVWNFKLFITELPVTGYRFLCSWN